MPTDTQQVTSRPDRQHPDPAELEEEREALILNVGTQIARVICKRTGELGGYYRGVLGAIRDPYTVLPNEAWRAAEERLNRMSGA